LSLIGTDNYDDYIDTISDILLNPYAYVSNNISAETAGFVRDSMPEWGGYILSDITNRAMATIISTGVSVGVNGIIEGAKEFAKSGANFSLKAVASKVMPNVTTLPSATITFLEGSTNIPTGVVYAGVEKLSSLPAGIGTATSFFVQTLFKHDYVNLVIDEMVDKYNYEDHRNLLISAIDELDNKIATTSGADQIEYINAQNLLQNHLKEYIEVEICYIDTKIALHGKWMVNDIQMQDALSDIREIMKLDLERLLL
jgi:hypothetical protein